MDKYINTNPHHVGQVLRLDPLCNRLALLLATTPLVRIASGTVANYSSGLPEPRDGQPCGPSCPAQAPTPIWRGGYGVEGVPYSSVRERDVHRHDGCW